MRAEIARGTAHGTVSAPPSKSYAHRMMLCAALAHGCSQIDGVGSCEDVSATMDCLSAMGVRTVREGNRLIVEDGTFEFCESTVFPCRESGSTLRFFIPLSAVLGNGAVFTGSSRLLERGIGIYEELFAQKGVAVTHTAQGIAVSGKLRAGTFTLAGNVSSQFVSGLLFALPLLEGDSCLRILPPVESKRYIDMTVAVLASFGITVTETAEHTFFVPGNQRYQPRNLSVEGDWSNAAFLHALNAFSEQVEVRGLRADSLQGDACCLALLRRLEEPQPPTIELSDCPDLGPLLFAVAAAKHGAVFTGTARLRIKESDRGQVMAQELAKFGIATTVEENRVIVHGGTLRAPRQPLNGHNDHRIVMALSVLATLTGAVIEGAEAVRKSYPDFFDDLKRLGLEVHLDE